MMLGWSGSCYLGGRRTKGQAIIPSFVRELCCMIRVACSFKQNVVVVLRSMHNLWRGAEIPSR
jgi:hypothetical protein